MRKKKIISGLKIESVASGGAGVGYSENRIVFCAKAYPGDEVRARIKKRKKSHTQAELIDIERSSLNRIVPPCLHFPRCGGCKWQGLLYEEQLQYKTQLVKNAFKHIGRFPEEKLPLKKIIPAPQLLGYRNKMEFSFGYEKRKLTLGLHEPGSWNSVFDVSSCLLFPREGNEIVQFTREKAMELSIRSYNNYHHFGSLRFLMIKRGENTGEILVNLISSSEDSAKAEKLANMIGEEFPYITTVVHGVTDSKAAVAVAEKETIVKGEGTIREVILGKEFLISSNTFFQSNTRQAETLFKRAFELANIREEGHVLELYSGTGAISLLASEKAEFVTAVEIVKESVERAKENAKINGISNCRFINDDVKKVVPLLQGKKFSSVIIDPPRPGVDKSAVEVIRRISPENILYISCNPDTLARDAELLTKNRDYEIKAIQPVDMFPQTPHIETIAVFRKNV